MFHRALRVSENTEVARVHTTADRDLTSGGPANIAPHENVEVVLNKCSIINLLDRCDCLIFELIAEYMAPDDPAWAIHTMLLGFNRRQRVPTRPSPQSFNYKLLRTRWIRLAVR